VLVRLEHVKAPELRTLIADAWETQAPKEAAKPRKVAKRGNA
jgi:hypothetical protein